MFGLNLALARLGREMFGDNGVAGLDDDLARSGDDVDLQTDVFRRHGVTTALVVDAAFGIDFAGDGGRVRAELGVRRKFGQFDDEQVGGFALGGGVEPDIGGVAAPVQALGVEIGEIGEGASEEETAVEVLDGAFDFTLGARPIRPASLDLKTAVGGKVEECGIELLGGEAHLLHVVVENGGGHAAKVLESAKVAVDQHGQVHGRDEVLPPVI